MISLTLALIEEITWASNKNHLGQPKKASQFVLKEAHKLASVRSLG
jgi:hypothetical protein